MQAKARAVPHQSDNLQQAICSAGGGPRAAGGGWRSIFFACADEPRTGRHSSTILGARIAGSFVAHLQLASRAAGRARSATRALLLLATLATATSACTDDETVTPTPHVVTLDGKGGYSITLETTSVSFELKRGDEVLTTFDGGSFALGVADAVDDATNYDPWPLVDETPGYYPPAGAAFLPATKVLWAELDDAGALVVSLAHEGGATSTLTIEEEGEGSFRARIVPDDPARVAWLTVGAKPAPDEAFYGLGELYDDVNQRGKRRAMQIELGPFESGYNEAHVPVPFLIGTRGWGLFVETSLPGVFDVAVADPSRVAATFGAGTAAREGLTFHLFGAPAPLDVTKRYYDVTGYPRLPAPWALGPLVWRDENTDQAQFETDLETMRDLDLPTSGVWIDRPYATSVNTFDFDATKFPDPKGAIDKAHALGFRVSVWHVPYLDEGDPSTQPLRDEVEAAGYYPITSGLKLNKWGRLIDFTAAGATSYWRDHLAAYTSLGIEGFKLDYAEDVVPGALGIRNAFEFHDGSDERTMHRGYTLLYHAAYAEMLPEDGGFLLCRAGKWGDQIHGPIIWPGDLDARLWKQGEEVTEGGETLVAVGGLHASMIAGLTLGPSGFPFYGADTGGYQHAPPDHETFRRWFEQTALSSVMQIGTSTNDVAWEFGDPELLDSYRFYTRLHTRLFPYAWTYATRIAETGHPIQRPYGLQAPAQGQHPSDEYFFGDDLLVAPVTEAGVEARDVLLPEGDWIGFFDGARATGPATITAEAPLGTLPLYLRAGALVPMLRPTIDTLAPTTEPDRVDSFANDPGALWILTSPGPAATFDLYDGTHLEQSQDPQGRTVISIKPGDVFISSVRIQHIARGKAPVRVQLADLTLDRYDTVEALEAAGFGYVWDADDRGGTLTIASPLRQDEVLSVIVE